MDTKKELIHTLTDVGLDESPQPAVNNLLESAEELKAMGFRDIKNVDEAAIINEAMKNIQIQRTLNDINRQSFDKRSAKDYLENHIEFLYRVSTNKSKKDIADKITLEHASAILKTTAKMEVPEQLLKKHLKNLKKKYS